MLDHEWRYPPETVDWSPPNDVSCFYIEGFKFENDPGNEGDPRAWRYGELRRESEVGDWVGQQVRSCVSLIFALGWAGGRM
jgi:hypothetical protein